ncbi:T9SS type A sorting domain-containing protein, partial [Algoriella sp.]|uniref:T9SS type A sorting domain-containing protein n=3 Tax=Algoriella sp. TaxID=1872434 RepID=UPI002FCB4E76
YDKVTNKVIDVNEATEISFVADDKINDRFEFYWNEKPSTLGTDDLNGANATYLYTNNSSQFVKFEEKNTTADIAVYDISGKQIFNKVNVSTNTDYKLNLINVPSVYVVKIAYKNGKVVTKKTINK